MARKINDIDCGSYSANDIAFDKSGKTIALASDDSIIRLISIEEEIPRIDSLLKGHTDTAQGVIFEPNSRTLISCGSDCEFKVWT